MFAGASQCVGEALEVIDRVINEVVDVVVPFRTNGLHIKSRDYQL